MRLHGWRIVEWTANQSVIGRRLSIAIPSVETADTDLLLAVFHLVATTVRVETNLVVAIVREKTFDTIVEDRLLQITEDQWWPRRQRRRRCVEVRMEVEVGHRRINIHTNLPTPNEVETTDTTTSDSITALHHLLPHVDHPSEIRPCFPPWKMNGRG